MTAIDITLFTDPGCPWAFSAEPHRRRLMWRYGSQLSWTPTLIVLAKTDDEYLQKGVTPEKMKVGFAKIQHAHGMPIDGAQMPRSYATIDACRTVVAVRQNSPDHAMRVVRALAVARMSGELIDEQDVIDRAVANAGLDPADMAGWVADPETEEALAADMAAARAPSAAGLAFPDKLVRWEQGLRYSGPSLEFRVDGELVYTLPGFHNADAWEAAIANINSGLERSDAPATAREVLEWADEPLSTMEIAAVMGTGRGAVRDELAASAASFVEVGADGYWSLATADMA